MILMIFISGDSPNAFLEPDSFLIIMASDKDRTQIVSEWQTIIDIGDFWYYHIPDQELPPDWNQLNYDHTDWDIGAVDLDMVIMMIILKCQTLFQFI